MRKTFVQYDEFGNITATVIGVSAPDHPRQIELESHIDITTKKIDINNKEIIDIHIDEHPILMPEPVKEKDE